MFIEFSHGFLEIFRERLFKNKQIYFSGEIPRTIVGAKITQRFSWKTDLLATSNPITKLFRNFSIHSDLSGTILAECPTVGVIYNPHQPCDVFVPLAVLLKIQTGITTHPHNQKCSQNHLQIHTQR